MRLLPAVLLASVLSWSASGQTYTISTFAGGALPVNIPGTSASLTIPYSVAVDGKANLFFVDQNTVLRLDATTGTLTLVAGNGTPGFSGDNGPATGAQSNGPAGLAVDSAGDAHIADEGNGRVRVLTPSAAPAPLLAINAVVNAASYIGGSVSPGEIVTIFGTAIGPATAAGGTIDPSTGKLATMTGGVQVLFNGIPAPMIYAKSTQVSAVTAPGLFTQNASGNGPGNPAAKGSIVQMFLTGDGQTNPPSVTGAITTATLPPPQVTPATLPPTVTINGQPALYVYAGEAPGEGHARVGGMRYPVALMPTEEGYSVSCPGLPGCWSQGATEEEALANIQDAIREYVEVAKELAGRQNLREVEIPA